MPTGKSAVKSYCAAALLWLAQAAFAADAPPPPASTTPAGTSLPSCKKVAEKKKSPFGAILGKVASAAVDQTVGQTTGQLGGLSGVAAGEAVNQARQSDCVP